MGEGYWVIRTWECGSIAEKVKYWISGQRPTKSERRLKAETNKKAVNESQATKRMARLINLNWPKGKGGVLVRLGYSDDGVEYIGGEGDGEEWADKLYHAAHHQLRLWMRRVRRTCKQEGMSFRCIAVTSDMDGKTGEYKRVHHHVIMDERVVALALAKWELGSTHHKRLWRVHDQSGLAEYLMNQVRRLPDAKKYIPTRNLLQPQAKDRIAKSGAELAVPRGARLLYRREFRIGGAQYIRYITAKALADDPDEDPPERVA